MTLATGKRSVPNGSVAISDITTNERKIFTSGISPKLDKNQALTHGSAASWRHVNLLGEYDFSEERLKDSIGIKPPKLID